MSKPKKPHRRQVKKRRRLRGAKGLRLMPWKKVAAVYNQKNGEDLSRARIWQIGMAAEAKLRHALATVAVDAGITRTTEVAK